MFWVLDHCEGWLRLKSWPFIAIATIQDRDADENVIMSVCVCVCVCVHMWYHGKVLSSGLEVQTEGWDVDNLVNISIKSNGYFTPHWPDMQLPSVWCGFVDGELPANWDTNHNIFKNSIYLSNTTSLLQIHTTQKCILITVEDLSISTICKEMEKCFLNEFLLCMFMLQIILFYLNYLLT